MSEADELEGLDIAIHHETVQEIKKMMPANAPTFEEIVQLRFGSSHGRVEVQEVTSEHGRQKVPANNGELQSFNSAHGRGSSHGSIHTKKSENWQTELHKQNSASIVPASRQSSGRSPLPPVMEETKDGHDEDSTHGSDHHDEALNAHEVVLITL